MKKIFKLMLLAVLGIFALASCEDVPMPYPNPNGGEQGGNTDVEIAPEGDGTLASPYNVAGVIAYINSLENDTESPMAVYIKGKVANNSTSDATISQYGNMTFTMIDEGNTKATFTAFQVYGLDKKKFTSVDQIKEGDEVVVYGKVVNYKGNTPETVGKGQAYVCSINSQGGSDTPDQPGVEAKEVTCAEAAALTNEMSDGATSAETYSVTGYITDVFATISKGQQSFWMADTQDGGKVLQAYWANLPEGVNAFTKGSKVKITGQLMKYVKDGNVTPEIKNADVVILEAGSNDNGGGNNDQPSGDGTEIDCAKAAQLALALEDKAESAEMYTVTGYITETDGKISRDQQTFWMADTKDGGKVFEAYWANIPDPTKALPVGTKVKMTGKLMRYGSTPEMKNGTVVVLEMGNGDNNDGGNSGGDNNTTSDAMTIANLPSNITTNAYGTQNASDESTWLKWTWNNIEFAGARVCKANAIDGTIQFQGNASDKSKQGFVFNKTAWSKNITKITLVLKVQASSTYDPSYSLYAGTEAHPTTSAITPTSVQTTDAAGNRVYTQTFDLSAANAKFFTIYNDKAGALYVQSIAVE